MSTQPLTPSRPPKAALRWLQINAQICLLILIWSLADRIATLAHLPVSGGILGLLILVALLLSGVVKPTLFEQGGELLLANMLLYFIPLVVSVVQYTSLLESEGLKLMVAIGVGFTCVLVTTAFTVEWLCAWTRKRQLQRLTAQRSKRVLQELV